jgi:hypothetical protein
VIRKTIIAGVFGVLAIAMSGGSAWAFECYNTQRSDRGNEQGANGQAMVSVPEFLAGFVGLCPAGVDHVVEGLEAEGFDTSILINGRALMAGGLEKNGKHEKLEDGKGIDHLSDEFIETADALIGEGFGICAD